MNASTPGAVALEATESLLAKFVGAPIEVDRRAASIVITPQGEGAFPITLYDQTEDAMISAERWHTHYEEPEQAAFCAMWLLTPFFRIVHELKGGVLVAAWVERYEATGWEPSDAVYFLNPEDEESWRLAPGETFKRRYLQQGVLPSPRPYEEFCPGVKLDERGLPPDFHAGSRLEDADEPIGPTLF